MSSGEDKFIILKFKRAYNNHKNTNKKYIRTNEFLAVKWPAVK